MKKIDLTGLNFGRLTVSGPAPKIAKRLAWACVCSCGERLDVRADYLRRNLVRSCGCLQKEETGARFRTHGLSKSSEYVSWCKAKNRCYNPTDDHYPYYGARGIKMADEWVEDFPAFLAHIGPKPSHELTLDRIEVEGDYAPGNVRWATRREQRINQRRMK